MNNLFGYSTRFRKRLWKKTRYSLAVLCGTLLLAGCGYWPPVANTRKDILRAPIDTENIRARALPDEDFASLRHLPRLRYLDLYGGYAAGPAKFSDRGLAILASLDLPHLETVFFGYCPNVTDASLTYLLKLKKVTVLGFVACPGITDAGLKTLAGMNSLRELDLRGCPNVTDEGLARLAKKSNWRSIEFGGCPHVTADAVAALQRKFPNAQINKDNEEWSYHVR